jgi:chemotaxis-related protein WspB
MLLLLFEIGEERYALPTTRVREIIPLVRLKKIPKTADYLAGLINFRGQPVPVVDLCVLIDNRSCEARLSTRIIMMEYPREGDNSKLLGMIAENVTETFKSEFAAPTTSGVLLDKNLYDQGVKTGSDEMIQWFDLKKILPAQEIERLLQD